MNWRSPTWAAIVLLLAGCASPPQAESRPDSRSARPPIPIIVQGLGCATTEQLLDAGKREIAAFQEGDRRATALDDATFAMKRWLREKGLAHAVVEFAMEPHEDSVQRVVITVTEGPRATLAALALQGNTSFSTARLMEFFDVRDEGAGPEESVVYRQRDVDARVSNLESFYLGAGYYRVHVGPPRVDWSDGDTKAHVVVPIVEGRQYLVGRVDVVLDGPDDEVEVLRERVRGFEGRPYSVEVPAAAAAEVRAQLASEGRLLMRVFARSAVDDDTGIVTVAVRVHAGPRVRVDGLAVHGNERTDGDFIFEQSGLTSGAILTQSTLDRAIDGLYTTGLFKSVRVTKSPGEARDDVAPTDIDIAVEELDARIVDFEAGYGSYEQLRGAVRYRDRNLFGTGRVLEAVPSVSLRSYGADVKFFDNYLLGRENTLEVTAAYAFREEPSFDSTAAAVEVAVRHRFDHEMSARAGYRFRHSDASNLGLVLADTQSAEAGITSGPFAEVEFDSRDNVFIPHRGVLIRAGSAWSTPLIGAELDFLEATASIAAFFELGDGTVLAARSGVRTRAILDGRADLPIQERYFLGGEHSVRSFHESELGPSDGNGHPTGGLSSLEASVELRQRLVGDLECAVFADAGVVNARSCTFAGPFGYAVGVGLRYLLPFGPVRLDVGFNPGARFAADDSWALQFSFGFSF